MESGASSVSNPPERHHVHYYLIIIAMVSILFTFLLACTAVRTWNKENPHPQQPPNTPNQLESGSVRRNESHIITDPPPVYTREPVPEQPSVLTTFPEMMQTPPGPDSTTTTPVTAPVNVVALPQHRPPSYDEQCLGVQKQCHLEPVLDACPPSA